ncbi:hypothetical protein G6F56_003570 [Rhizopus delemar]|uniref:Uncharacterized protein n=1 Tax=Rhizopus stolonifer TaxID=4846 RepID=A0A367IJY4_RHIST|nr:hypothetical protein G6F56_003570 [Rhizopus delemar]RCH77985.1 hypothetical protein CU098_005850 [Rhizopus stolonifer]
MPYGTDDVIYKLNEIIRSNEDFQEEMRRSLNDIRRQLDRLYTTVNSNTEIVSNQNRKIKSLYEAYIFNWFIDNSIVSRIESHTSTVINDDHIKLIPSQPVSTRAHGNGERPRLLGYIRETMGLVKQRDDTEQIKKQKRDSATKILKRLNKLALAVCEGINANVEADTRLDQSKMTWEKLPSHYKESTIPRLINMAKKTFIPLDRSDGD